MQERNYDGDLYTHLFIRIIDIFIRTSAVFILVVILVVLIVKLVKLIRIHIVTQFLKLEGFPREPIDGSGYEFLLDIFSKLVVKLEAFFNIRSNRIIIFCGGLWGSEEVEERLCRYRNLDNTGLFRI